MVTNKSLAAKKSVGSLEINALENVRVCFVNNPLRESAKPNTPPQGPGLLAARLRQYGALVSILDLNAYRINDQASADKNLPNGRHLSFPEAEALIERHFNHHGEPHVVALSGKITTLRWQKWVSETCRKLVPNAFQISGGGLATEFREGLFNWMPHLDAIGHSEGDDIILLCAYDVKNSWKRPGSKLSSGEHLGVIGGKDRYVYHGDRPLDLDMLPFAAWDLLHQDVDGNPVLEWYIKTPVWGTAANNSSAAPFEMKRSLTTVSSRGCPYACAFCFRGAQGERNWGIRSAPNLRQEAEWLIANYQVDFIGFPDDNFAVSPKRCQELPDAFRGLNFKWGTHTRLDECTPDRLAPMAESGCVYIGVGAESAAKNTLERMKKGGQILRRRGKELLTHVGGYVFPTVMMEGIQNCRSHGIHTNATWMMAYPGETLHDLQTSVAFIMWQTELYTAGLTPGTEEYTIAQASVNRKMFTATAYPGTTMFDEPAVREKLSEHFSLSFNAKGPVCDNRLEAYVLELDDATKVLQGADGQPLNFSAMPDDTFLEARHYADSNQIEKILAM